MDKNILIMIPSESIPEAEALLTFIKNLSDEKRKKFLDFIEGVAYGISISEKAG